LTTESIATLRSAAIDARVAIEELIEQHDEFDRSRQMLYAQASITNSHGGYQAQMAKIVELSRAQQEARLEIQKRVDAYCSQYCGWPCIIHTLASGSLDLADRATSIALPAASTRRTTIATPSTT
jgi:hypothetical protein